MGYTHYWYRKPELPRAAFIAFAQDVMKIRTACEEAGVPLAGPHGKGEPEITEELIAFNGVEACGHRERNLGITWPARDAIGGVATGTMAELARTGTWFAGAELTQRTCGGDCSHESFYIERAEKIEADSYARSVMAREGGYTFSFTKTAYKPYDIAVTAALIAARHRFGRALRVGSDGEERDWQDARTLCAAVLGYGADFSLKLAGEKIRG